ncbi:MmgE/PrpD family protein [Devosia sp. A369]
MLIHSRPTLTYSEAIADFISGFKLSDVPPEVVARAKLVLLDGLGCGLFGANVKWTEILAKVVAGLEPSGGTATVWGRNETASATNAALINGTMVQGYELDDANPATIHSCAAVLPAAIAAAEYVGADKIDGERLLTAIIAGFEIGPRIGLCMNGNRMLVKGWHSPGIFAPFPASVAAGIVLGLDKQQMKNAIGIAGPQAAGLMATQFGSMVKRVLCAKGSQSGLYAALLAAEGFTGIDEVFEQEYGGYCRTFTGSADEFDLHALTDGLGTRWETMRISIKRHATVGTNLSALDVIEELMEEGLKAQDVDRVTVRMTEDAVRHSYWTPYEPVGLTAAQMHLGFCIGMKLIEGEVFVDQMVEENIARPDVLEMCKRVEVLRDEEREKKGRPFARGADVEVLLKNGQTIRRVTDHFRGSFQKPMSQDQMLAKYRRLAGKSLTPQGVAELESLVMELETQPSVTKLIETLRGV